mmetsp:Transcript_47309/g.122347  ORF Transcript_47309/g.122347 Transcript_47309/m.122347 type:complete len:295 (+) Transcript_47309:253-1137(+)
MASYLPPPLWAQPAIPSLQSSCIDAVASLVTSGLLKEELLFPPVIAQKVLDRVLVQAGKSAKVQHLYPFDGEDIVAFSNVIGDDNDKDNVTIDMTPAWMFHISRHSQLERLTIARSKKNLHPSSFPCLCRFGSLTHLDLHSSASVCADMFRSFPSLQHLRDLRLGGCTQVDDEGECLRQRASLLFPHLSLLVSLFARIFVCLLVSSHPLLTATLTLFHLAAATDRPSTFNLHLLPVPSSYVCSRSESVKTGMPRPVFHLRVLSWAVFHHTCAAHTCRVATICNGCGRRWVPFHR